MTADLTATDADDGSASIDAWRPSPTRDEVEATDRVREPRPLVDYFERMRERGLLD